MKNLWQTGLRVNQLAIKAPTWVALAVARLTQVPGHHGVPPSFAGCAARTSLEKVDGPSCKRTRRQTDCCDGPRRAAQPMLHNVTCHVHSLQPTDRPRRVGANQRLVIAAR